MLYNTSSNLWKYFVSFKIGLDKSTSFSDEVCYYFFKEKTRVTITNPSTNKHFTYLVNFTILLIMTTMFIPLNVTFLTIRKKILNKNYTII